MGGISFRQHNGKLVLAIIFGGFALMAVLYYIFR
jgi:hypothetical protein